MPRLPTMRVMGSHAISTRPFLPSPMLLGLGMIDVMAPPFCAKGVGRLPGASGAGGQLLAGFAPLRLLVERGRRLGAQGSHGLAVRLDRVGRELAPGRLVHERHELVGEARHCAADADASDVGATPHTCLLYTSDAAD